MPCALSLITLTSIRLMSECFDELLVEGTEASITEVKKNARGEFEIHVRQIPWDRFYYDPHSRKRDFTDASFMGITTWMGLDEAKRLFKDKAEDIDTIANAVVVDTHEDRPKWRDKKKNRIRFNQHYFKKDGHLACRLLHRRAGTEEGRAFALVG